MIIVELLTSPASIKDMEHFAALATLTCHANTEREFIPHEVLGRIIKAGHESILEHINLTYSIKGLSRACLQELARHRHISLSVESTRHTLKKNINDPNWVRVNLASIANPAYCASALTTKDVLLAIIKQCGDISNDELKYFIPEFWPTNLMLTSNVRELRHILDLRTTPAALKEFRGLARAMYETVPDQFKYLLKDCVHEETKHD